MTNHLPYLIVIGGPTASGKTALAISLAERLQTEIINADSRQFYREMNIGTARPGPEECERVPHHFVGDRSLQDPLNAGVFGRQAVTKLQELFRRHDQVILSGGSGLFVKAVTEGLDDFPSVPASIRSQIDDLFQQGGLAALQEALSLKDPLYFASVDQQNPARLRRALEVIETTGQPFSSFHTQHSTQRPFHCIYLAAYRRREVLYERINKRVDQMMQHGLLAEAKSLLAYQDLSVLRTLGYQELFAHLRGEYDLATAVEQIKQGSRRYAKRQITWLRRDGYWKNIDPDQPQEAIDYLKFVRTHRLALTTEKREKEQLVKFVQDQRVLAQQTYALGKKATIGAVVAQPSIPMAAQWLRQEAERRITQ